MQKDIERRIARKGQDVVSVIKWDTIDRIARIKNMTTSAHHVIMELILGLPTNNTKKTVVIDVI